MRLRVSACVSERLRVYVCACVRLFYAFGSEFCPGSTCDVSGIRTYKCVLCMRLDNMKASSNICGRTNTSYICIFIENISSVIDVMAHYLGRNGNAGPGVPWAYLALVGRVIKSVPLGSAPCLVSSLIRWPLNP